MKNTQDSRNPRKHTDSVNAHTAFHLASVSKTFTAMAILKLWELGKLDIHDDISKYLTGFPPGISIKNLLSQRSGLRNYVHFMDQSGLGQKKIPDKRRFIAIHYSASRPGRLHSRRPSFRIFQYQLCVSCSDY